MTRNQMAWAQQHDWFVNATIKPQAVPIDASYATVIVKDESVLISGEVVVTYPEFESFKELRAWAGY